MDYYDHPHAFFTEPVSGEGTPRYSVGYYRGRRRVTIGWFMELETAECFAERMQVRFPWFRIDVLKSLF